MSTIIIPARYASTRFPGKVMAEIGGKPMIVRVAEQCLKTEADQVYVAADDERVAEAVRALGVPVVMTPPDLPTGTDRIAMIAKDLNDDIIINVQGDEPFIPPTLINSLIKQLKDEDSLNMNSACTVFKHDADVNNPAHVKVVLDKNGYALYFSRLPIPFDRDGNINPLRYKHIGIYGYRRKFLLEFAQMDKTPLESSEMLEQLRALESGERIKMVKTDYMPLSVDTREDLKLAEDYFNKSRS